MMRDIASTVIRELKLDYAVTFISGEAGEKHELVIRERPRDSCFLVRLGCTPSTPSETIALRLKDQLQQRLTTLQSGHDLFGDRRPLRADTR